MTQDMDKILEFIRREGGKAIIIKDGQEFVISPLSSNQAAIPQQVPLKNISIQESAIVNMPNRASASYVTIANKKIGPNQPIFIVAEIGINHNGDVNIAKQLINTAVSAGADAVKFQKRTIDVVYTKDELDKPRESPFGNTNGDLKRGLEFGLEEYREIDKYCREKGILWFASPWDKGSVDFLEQFNLPCYKIASASLTDDDLLGHIKSKGKPIIISSGMSTLEEIDHALEILGSEDVILLHTISTYPASFDELNLTAIKTLERRYPGIPIGYSGHESNVAPSIMSAVLGACLIERHITLDRAMWGSDQAASLEPKGLQLIIRDIRLWEKVKGDGQKRVWDSELPIKEKLRKKY